MTPFMQDILQLILMCYEFILNTMCYFLGHKWGMWEKYDGEPIGAMRQCKRCMEYQHDRQMFIES